MHENDYETNNDTIKQNIVELGQKENKCVMSYRRQNSVK